MNTQTPATLFFPHLFQLRIISAGRQRRVHWYTCTKFSDDTAASIVSVLSQTHKISSKKFGRTTNYTRFVQLQIHKFHQTKHSHKLYPSSCTSNHKRNLLSLTVRATRSICYTLLDWVMPVKLTINYKCKISLYLLRCISRPLSFDTHSKMSAYPVGTCISRSSICISHVLPSTGNR